MKTVLSITFLVGSVALSWAQGITITSADVASAFAVGNSLITHTDTLTTTANIGSPGATQNNWDFSALATHLIDTATSVVPSGTPYFSWFPGATHTFHARETISGVEGTVYQYFALGTNLLDPGVGGNAPSPLGTITVRITNTPAAMNLQLPLVLSTGWTISYVESLVVTAGGLPLLTQATSHTVTNVVDGYGFFTLPGSFGVHQALRIRRDDRFSGTTGSGRRIYYHFLAQSGAGVEITAADTLQPNNGTINIDPFSTSWRGPLATSVRLSEQVPADFRLMQNYPNPFNPSTTIRYEVAAREPIQLGVYDVLGREVATLVNEVQDPGTYQVTWDATGLATGVYLYRLQSGPFVEMKKMLLTR